MERAGQIASLGPDLFDTFMREAGGLVKESLAGIDALERGSDVDEGVNLVFRAMHTLKGNARVFKLMAIQNVAHAVEEQLDSVRAGRVALTPESLAALREQVCQVGDVLDEFGKLGRQIRELNMISLGDILIPLQKMALELAREQNKKVADLEIVGGDILVDGALLQKIKDILLHALRNAVDHGLEPAVDRALASKPEAGKITVRCQEQDGELTVSVEDDGRGINTDRVKAKAFQLNLVKEEELDRVPEQTLLEFIFRPGFSTAEKVTEVSGRGVGMDVIRSRAEELHGSARVSSRRGQGTTLTLKFPVEQYQRR
jgi:chemotaxis protein histidine kinase CheA